MPGFCKHLARLLALAWFSLPGLAQAAWVETRVKAHTALLDIDTQGSAQVSQELSLAVRGGPLKSLEIQGLDADAVLDSEATATPVVRYGVPAPIPLTLARGDDGTLRIEINREKGLFTGSYLLRFSYRTQLLTRDRIRRRGTAAEVEWIGPRFADGIDVAKVIFRLPAGATTPSLATERDSDDVALGSTFVSGVRHASGKIELELVRPHVARGEPAIWRIFCDPKSFPGLSEPSPDRAGSRAARAISVEEPKEQALWVLAAVLVALGYCALVATKWSAVARACRLSAAIPLPLVPLPAALRATSAGALLSAAAVLGALGDQPTIAGFLLIAAMSLAAARNPRALPTPRGPGHWLALTDADAFAASKAKIPGRFLDLGALPGALLLLLLLAAFGVAAGALSSKSSYLALALISGSACLIPIFGTGRLSSLPLDRLTVARKLLQRIKQRQKMAAFGKLIAWARIPDGSRDPDELRLLFRLSTAKDGLMAIEIGIEHSTVLAARVSQPFILIRARQGSAAHQALPASVEWQRGRGVDESVAILKPSLPTVPVALALLEEVARSLSEAKSRTREQHPKRSTSALPTSKLLVSSPAHVAAGAARR